MTALLRYAFVKSLREHLLAGVLLTPLVMAVAPLLGLAVANVFFGRPAFPFRFDGEITQTMFASQLSAAVLLIATLGAGISAFYVFRAEVTSRAVGFFVLANRPRAFAAAAVSYGTIAGLLSYLIAVLGSGVLISALPPQLASHIAIATIASFVAAALGTASVVFSTEVTMLAVVSIGAAGTAVGLLNNPRLLAFALAIVSATLLAAMIPAVVRRRCAA